MFAASRTLEVESPMSKMCFILPSLQIKTDLERSMNDVFMKYDGQGADTEAVDYLQAQVGVIFLRL